MMSSTIEQAKQALGLSSSYWEAQRLLIAEVARELEATAPWMDEEMRHREAYELVKTRSF